MKQIFSVIIVLLMSIAISYGQKVTYDGKIIDMDTKKSMAGVTVRVLSDGTEVTSFTTSSNGNYTVQFAPGKVYTIEYNKPGYVSKIIKVDVVTVNEEDMPPGGKIFPPVDLDLFTNREGASFDFLKTEAVVEWYFDRDRMNFDSGKVNRTKKKISDRLIEAGESAGLNDAKYNALIQEADKLYNEKTYQQALDKYVSALQVPGKQAEKHPNNRLIEIEALLQKKAQEDLAYKQENQAYLNVIAAADNFASSKEYDKAIAKYTEASAMKSDEQYPKDKIIELKEELANAAKRDEFDTAIKQADGFFKQNSFQAARDKYQAASKLLPKEQYPIDQLELIAGKLDSQSAEREKKEKYNQAIAAADALFNKKDYAGSIEKYTEAITFESAATYPVERIGMAETKLAEQKAANENLESFNRLVTEGDEQVITKNFQVAVDKYNEALGLIEDAAVATKRDNAKIALDQQKAKEELRDQITTLLASADTKIGAQDFTGAIADFETVLGLDAENALAIAGKAKAESLLVEKESNAARKELESKIAVLLASADVKMGKQNFAGAIEDFDSALALESTNTFAIAGKEKAESLLAEKETNAAKKELEGKISVLLASADAKIASQNFTGAIEDFEAALALESTNTFAIAGKAKAESLLNEKESAAAKKNLDDQIAALISSANQKMTSENYTGAIEDYNAVLNLNAQHPGAIEGKGKAESLLAEKQTNAAKEESFNQLVTQADNAFDAEKWEEARTKYIAAKAIFDNKKHVNDRIDEIRTKLEKQGDQKRILAEIQVLLDQATDLKTKNKWSDVILKYEEAIKLDNQRDDVKDLLIAAKNSKQEWDAQQSIGEQFAQLKQDGNVFLAQKRWSEAKVKYEAALEIKADSEINSNLVIIAEKLSQEALSQENEAGYRAKMKAAELLATAEDYREALVTFKEALEYKKDDVIASNRIIDMQQKIKSLDQLAGKNERYNEAMVEGRKALDNKDYAAAIKFFDDALIEKPLDSEATKLKNNAKVLIKGLQSEEEQYMGLLQSGQSKYDIALSKSNHIPTLKEAKTLFEEAQKMRPNASLPQNKIVEIDELLRQIEEAKEQEGELTEINRRYEEQLDLAVAAAQGFKYENAIDYLKAASKIKPEEELPKKKIKEYQGLLDQISAQNEKEKRYSNLINKADLAFDNKNYQESITIYNQALGVKESEVYPKDQILKAKKGIEDLANSAVNKEYQNFIDKADAYFANNEYENALGAYRSALSVQLNDSYAKDKIDETQQILNNRKKIQKEDAEKLAEFRKRITEADALFNETEFIDAKKAYERALEINPNDVYANDRVQLSIIKSKEKTESGDDIRYQKILTKADEYFGDENYEKAIGLYERAIKLRSNDQYPIDKLAEITAIKNGNVKTESSVEYLGEQSNISIMEGAALLEQGAKQREQLKQQAVEKQLRKNEGLEAERSGTDYSERVAYENEITAIKDRRDQTTIDEGDKLRVFIEHVDNHEYDLELKSIQNDSYERGEVLRTNQNLVYIVDEMDATKDRFKEDHTLMVERVIDIKEARDDQNIAEAAHHKVRVTATGEEILKVDKKHEEFIAVNEEMRKDNEVRIDEIIKGRELRTFEENNSEYSQVMQLQNEALLAEIKVTESKTEKHKVNEQLQDDIYALDAALQRKFDQQTVEAYQDQLLIDSHHEAASNQYAESQEGKDDARQLALELLKEMDQKSVEQSEIRTSKQYNETQSSQKVVETVYTLQDEQKIQQKEDLAVINEEVISQESALERANNLRDQEEKIQRHNTVNELERINKQEELAKEGKDEKIKENYEDLKGLNASIDSQGQLKDEASKRDKFKTQELVNQLESNKLTFNETIANTLGDEYPEGVSQENYVRKDKDGIPVKIVTRRFVIKDGRGEVYIRIQSRNGLTYSKNGMPVTEQTWINGTENALLEKHY